MPQSKEAGASSLPKLNMFFYTRLRVSQRIDLPVFNFQRARRQWNSFTIIDGLIRFSETELTIM